ncbi:hypothetical protein L3Q82_015189, partial [Scortum barcoo]
DTTIVGLISDNDETHYREEIQHLTQWCSNNNLVLNTSKTKEVIVDYRSWLVKKAQQRLLQEAETCWTLPSAPDKLLQGHNRKQTERKTAQGIVGSPLPDLDSIYAGRVQKKSRQNAADPTHPGNGLFVLYRFPLENAAASVMKVLVVLALAVFTAGCNANIVWQNQPKQQVDMVKDAFWDYVAKATTTAEDTLRQIRESQLGKEVNTLISESTDAVNKLTDALQTQVAPLTQNFITQFTQEAEQLKARLEKDLTAVSTNLQPYAEEMVASLQRQVEKLKKEAAPYAESMDPEALKAVLLQKSQELKEQLEKSVNQLQAQMVPYTEEMKEKMEQSLDEFQKSMIPLAQSFETQLTQKTQEIQQNLAPLREELRARLDSSAQDLQAQLTALWESFSKTQ